MDNTLPPESQSSAPPPLAPPPLAPPPPPVPQPPPPIIPRPPAARPAGKGTGWMILAIVLLLLLGLSLVFNMRSMVGDVVSVRGVSEREAGPRMEEVLLKDNRSSSRIAVLDVEGVISGQPLEQGGVNLVTLIKEQLKHAREDSSVKAVILKVDSPGGEVLASDEIANAITEFQKKAKKPVVVSMGSLAASGGYYISAPCDWIVANELTITGSIGVIMHGLNYRGLLDKVGVRPQVYKSGKFKDMLSSTKEPEEISKEEVEMVQRLINETFDKFKDVVRKGRRNAYENNDQKGRMLDKHWEDYADGRILSGKEAQELGFVDELGDFDKAVERAESLARLGKKHANLIGYQPIFDISNLFHLFGKSEAKTLKVDLGIEIPKLRPGCMYFLAPTYLH